MRIIKAHKLNINDISFDSDVDAVKSLCVLIPNPEDVVTHPEGVDEYLVAVAKECAFFSWEFTDDDCGVYTFCTLTVNGRDVPIDSAEVHYMRGQAKGLAERMGCKYFVDLTPHGMGKAYNSARLSNRAEREFNTYVR